MSEPSLALLHPRLAALTSSQFGEVVAWQQAAPPPNEFLQPAFVLFPSATQASGKAASMCLTAYTGTEKIFLATLHQDLKVRVWDLEAQVCVNISEPQL